MAYVYNQYGAGGLGKAPAMSVPTPRPAANLRRAKITAQPPQLIKTGAKAVRTNVRRIKQTSGPKVKRVLPEILRSLRPDSWTVKNSRLVPPANYKPAEKITTTTPIISNLFKQIKAAKAAPGNISSFYSNPVVVPVASVRPAATLSTTASGAVAAILPAAAAPKSPPLVDFSKPLVEIIPKPTDPSVTEAGAAISPQAKTWLKYGVLAVGAFILWNAFTTPGSR